MARSGRGFDLQSAGGRHQGIGDQLSHARQELSAHAGMKAIPIRAAQCEQSNAALLTQRDQRHRADVIGVRPEEELALRVTSLSTSWLAIGEQRFERLEIRIVGTHHSDESLRCDIGVRSDEHQD